MASEVSYKDLLPIPATNPGDREAPSQPPNSDQPTDSHALAMAQPEEKGAVQVGHDEDELVDLGWNEAEEKIQRPLVGGMDNEELWVLVRRFNKVCYRVKIPVDRNGTDILKANLYVSRSSSTGTD